MSVRMISAVLAGLVLAPLADARAQAPAPTAARVADLRWIAGHWVDATGGAHSEETWTEPRDGNMLGMWRLLQGGRARIFELLALSDEADGGVALRLRHFDPRLVGREDKESPVTFRLTSLEKDGATFDGPPTAKGPLRLTYRRTGPRTLAVTLDKEGGKEEFRFEQQR
jgi:hypothetical protein